MHIFNRGKTLKRNVFDNTNHKFKLLTWNETKAKCWCEPRSQRKDAKIKLTNVLRQIPLRTRTKNAQYTTIFVARNAKG